MKNLTLGLLGLTALSNACFAQAQVINLQIPPIVFPEFQYTPWPYFNGFIETPQFLSVDGMRAMAIRADDPCGKIYERQPVYWDIPNPVSQYLIATNDPLYQRWNTNATMSGDGRRVLFESDTPQFRYGLWIQGQGYQPVPMPANDRPHMLNFDGTKVLTDHSLITAAGMIIASHPNEFLKGMSSAGDAYISQRTLYRLGRPPIPFCDLAPPAACSSTDGRLGLISSDGLTVAGYFTTSTGEARGFSKKIGEAPVEFTTPGFMMQFACNSEKIVYFVNDEWKVRSASGTITPLTAILAAQGVPQNIINSCAGYPGRLIQISENFRSILLTCDYCDPANYRAILIRLDESLGCTPTCNDVDFNNDGSITPQDITDYLSMYSEGPCSTAPAPGCDPIDFNNDTSVFDPEDINAFLRVYSEGPCLE